MSWWSRLLRRGDRAPTSPPVAPARDVDPTEPTTIALLRAAVASGDAPTATRALDDAISRGEIGLALEVVAPHLKVSRLDDEAWTTVRTRAAAQLLERDRRALAIEILERSAAVSCRLALVDALSSPPTEGAIVPRADLERAYHEVQRVLAVDVRFPGARERFDRLRASLGRTPAPARVIDIGATLAVSLPTTRFRLAREVARGGAGVVYEAFEQIDAATERRVALKIAHDRSEKRAQIVAEARAGAALAAAFGRLSRGGLVRVLDVDEDAAMLSMVWLDGGSLRDVDGGARASTRWALDLATTLAAVHAAGWVHGDVKPANVLLDANGAAFLGDFGATREIGAASVPGSIGFVSPERAAGSDVDPRDDVYGFGALLDRVAHAGDRERAVEIARVAARCTNVADKRPRDGEALVALLERSPAFTGT